MKSTLKKLQEARMSIKAMDIEKRGVNEYSKYKYFTPEQISDMVHKACNPLNLLNIFHLVRTDLGLMAKLFIHDLDADTDPLMFEIATEIPEIKATNVAQQLGGCVTYSERYLLQIAYDIKDNNLDFDTPTKKTKEKTKPELTPDMTDKWDAAIKFLRESNGTLDAIREKYTLTSNNAELLINNLAI